jgi:hypothetical protein
VITGNLLKDSTGTVRYTSIHNMVPVLLNHKSKKSKVSAVLFDIYWPQGSSDKKRIRIRPESPDRDLDPTEKVWIRNTAKKV